MGSRPHCILIPDSFSLFVLRSMGEIGIETLSADFCSGHEERSAPALNGREIALSGRGSQNANAHWGLACVTVDGCKCLSLTCYVSGRDVVEEGLVLVPLSVDFMAPASLVLPSLLSPSSSRVTTHASARLLSERVWGRHPPYSAPLLLLSTACLGSD